MDDLSKLKIFRDLIESKHIDLSNVVFNGIKLSFPIESLMKDRYRFPVRPPFRYESRKKYKIKCLGTYYDLYKKCNCFYLIDLNSETSKTEELKKSLCCSIYYSYICAFLYDMFTEMNKNFSFKLTDEVFNPILNVFSDDTSELEVILTWFPTDFRNSDTKFYLSIFY